MERDLSKELLFLALADITNAVGLGDHWAASEPKSKINEKLENVSPHALQCLTAALKVLHLYWFIH